MRDYYAPIILLLAFTGVIFLYDYYTKIKNERILRAEIIKNFGKNHSSWFKLRQNNREDESQHDKAWSGIFLL